MRIAHPVAIAAEIPKHFSDAFAPGWRVTVDGAPSEILPADVAFRGIALREGQHDVVFTYRPWAWTVGVPLVSLGLLLGLAYWLGAILSQRSLARRTR